jgi:hypothetical protein
MNHSDIFEDFIKIAEEKGLISKDAPEKAKKILEDDPRWDSLDISAIEALYGVKPDVPKEQEYKKNIMEIAHPNSLVISPSYDKLNGLVENNMERQNIMLNIVNKPTNGLLTQHKWASKELLLTLVRVANDLDNKDQNDLRVLADVCLDQITEKKKIVKQAFWPLAGAIGATIGLLYLQQHLPFLNEGFETNHQKLIAEIDDLITSSSSWGVGKDYTESAQKMFSDFKNKIMSVHDLYTNRIAPIILDMEKPSDAKELIESAKDSSENAAHKAKETLQALMLNLNSYIMKIESDFKSQSFKVKQVANKGFVSSLIDKAKILHGGYGLIADDFDDVVRALQPYKESIAEIIKTLDASKSKGENAANDLDVAFQSAEKQYGIPSEKEEQSAPKEDSDEDNSIKSLEEKLKQHGIG